MEGYNWKWRREGRMAQVILENGEDIAHLAELDKKNWSAISMPVKGVRFDGRTLELLDSDGDGRIRTPEVIAAIDFLKAKNVDLDSLFHPTEEDEKKLADVLARQADVAALPPGKADAKALADWEAEGKKPEVAVLGDRTAAGEAALSAVEGIVDAFFAPPEDMPLVTEAPDVSLPLRDHLNPKHLEAVMAFAEACAKPILGEATESIDRVGWKKIKAAFAPYRAWLAAKPVVNAGKKAELVEEERVLRYKLHLLEFLENYVNMRHLYGDIATFQTGTLRIDAKEIHLCFHVDSEAAHSALSGRSNCCVLYLKLTRPSEKAERSVCAVVTAGPVAQLYAGRNGVFYDRDGKDWDAVVTKVVESQVSLLEAFWTPWRKLGEGIGKTVKKFIGEKQTASQAKVEATSQSAQAGSAAMASSVAAVGIGIGMVSAGAAALMGMIAGMSPKQIAISIAALILVVSLPSVILTWFKLRKRDLGAILNAGGWAINRPMYFSMKRGRVFTVCARNPLFWRCFATVVVIIAIAVGGWRVWKVHEECKARDCQAQCAGKTCEAKAPEAAKPEAAPAPAATATAAETPAATATAAETPAATAPTAATPASGTTDVETKEGKTI
ncbi:MAG: hypothetical protein K6F50_10535 [Kiritimatiellae bacterium]|nr:hypothetical protein [Kiritimatiellia bacterium]